MAPWSQWLVIRSLSVPPGLVMLPGPGCVEIIPTFLQDRGLYSTQLVEAQNSLLGYVPPSIGKAKYESEVANCDGRRLKPGKTVLATCEHKWQLY